MTTAIRYFSKTGHTKKMAQIVSTVTGAKAESIDVPVSEQTDILFLGTSVYYAGVDGKVKDFINNLDPQKVKCVVCFGTAAIITSSYSQVKGMLEKHGIAVSDKEFHCRGQFKLLHRGHPNADDLVDLKKFTEQFV